MFVYHVILLTNQGHTVGPDGPVYLRSPLIFNPDTKKEVWRFISYMLVHSGYFHIAFNVVIQVTIDLLNFLNLRNIILVKYIFPFSQNLKNICLHVYNKIITCIQIPKIFVVPRNNFTFRFSWRWVCRWRWCTGGGGSC